MQDSEQDINEVFDDILFIEEKLVERGYEEGYNSGVEEGNIDGYHFGYHRGAEIGAQMGYYTAFTKYWLSNTDNLNEKHRKTGENLLKLIESFPKANIEELDIIQLASDIQAQFKKLTSLLKVDASFNESNKLSF